MRYNVRIFGKRYKNKTIDEIYNLMDGFSYEFLTGCRVSLQYIKNELKHLKPTVTRSAYYGHNNKIVFSINKTRG